MGFGIREAVLNKTWMNDAYDTDVVIGDVVNSGGNLRVAEGHILHT
jgi:hypothetical protein